jgi:hypothetical protein
VARPYGGRIAPRAVYVGPRYYRPYYTFRPRFSIGFGIWAGYPVTYPAYGAYDYGYPPPYAVQGYPAPGYVTPGYPSQGYPSQGYPSQGYPSQGYPSQNDPQGYSTQPYPAPSSPSSRYPSSSGGNGGYAPEPSRSIDAQPSGQPDGASGAVSFEISPSNAAVLVD